MLCLLPILLGLGFWQLQRAHYKSSLISTYRARHHASPLSSTALDDQSPQQLQFYPLSVKGIYDNARTLLVENQFQHHHLGYRVLTPFHANGAKHWLLVDRGWIARSRNRAHLPYVPPILGEQTLQGIIKLIPPRRFTLGSKDNRHSWPRLIPTMDLRHIHHVLQRKVYPLLLQLPLAVHYDPIRQWQVTTISPEKHYGYAVQWFALALTLVIIYLVVNTRRETDGK